MRFHSRTTGMRMTRDDKYSRGPGAVSGIALARGFLACALVLGASGCTFLSQNKNVGSRVPVRSAFVESRGGGSPVAGCGWLEEFRDPTLESLVREAWDYNPDLYTAAAVFEEASARGARIETPNRHRPCPQVSGRPSREGRGLKPASALSCEDMFRRPSGEGRGLKPVESALFPLALIRRPS